MRSLHLHRRDSAPPRLRFFAAKPTIEQPGAIATDLSGGLVRDNPEVNKRVAEMTALGRATVPDDIGPVFAALHSDDNRRVNGQRIEVSGGMLL